jgi:hypothetical protein
MRTKHASLFLLLAILLGWSVTTSTAQDAGKVDTEQPAEPRLSESQRQTIKDIQIKAAKRAAPIALQLAHTARRVYENMLRDREDQRLRVRLDAEMHKVAGELLTIKGQSIRDVLRVLTPEQRKLVRTEMVKPGAPADLMELLVRIFKIPES